MNDEQRRQLEDAVVTLEYSLTISDPRFRRQRQQKAIQKIREVLLSDSPMLYKIYTDGTGERVVAVR